MACQQEPITQQDNRKIQVRSYSNVVSKCYFNIFRHFKTPVSLTSHLQNRKSKQAKRQQFSMKTASTKSITSHNT